VVLEQVDRLDAHRLAVRHELFPILLRVVRDRRGHDAVVDARVVRHDVEVVAAVVGVVLVIGLARDHHHRVGFGLVGGDQACFIGRLAVGDEEDPVAAARALGVNVEELVLLVVEQRVFVRADDVAVEVVLALGVVLGGVENRLVVGGPEQRAGALDGVGQHLAGGQVLDLQLVLAIAVVVGREEEELAVVADLKVADGHELLPLGELVDVEQDLLGRIHVPLAPRVDRVLLPLDRPRVIEVAVVLAIGNVDVGLLDAAEHLVVELFLQLLRRREHGVRVRVLGLEIGDGLGTLLVAQPAVVVGALVAVKSDRLRDLLRDGRLRCVGGGGGHGKCGHEQGDDGRLHRRRVYAVRP
jgi:hypothetical protein